MVHPVKIHLPTRNPFLLPYGISQGMAFHIFPPYCPAIITLQSMRALPTTLFLGSGASVEGQVPTLSLDKTQYCAGNSWRLRIDCAASSSSVQLMGISLGTPWELPDWRSTDLEGTLTESGTFASNDVGDHTLWALSAGKTSNSIGLKIVSCPK